MEGESRANQRKTESTVIAKLAVKQFCETSTIHGISSIYNASNTLQRTFWVGIFLTVNSLMIWQVSELVIEIYKRDVLITSRKVSYDQLDFPCVIVSNAGPYSKSKLRSLVPRASGSIENMKKIISNLSAFQVYQLSSDLQHSCKFQGKECQAGKDIFPLIGKYLMFNRNFHWRQMNPGPESGLELILNINESDYANVLKHGYGVLIYIGELFVTYSHLHNKGIAVAPGTLTKINMQVTKTTRLPHPYPDNCVANTDVKELQGFHSRFTLSRIYSLEFCKFLAMLRAQMTSCGVVDPQYKFLIDLVVIIEKSNVSYTISGDRSKTESTMSCLKRVANEKIKSNCRRPCKSQKFDYTVSYLRWPTEDEARERLKELKKSSSKAGNWTLEDIYKNLLKVQIYFSEFDVDEIVQKPAHTWKMIPSKLGGLIGLYIGASVYSGLEVFSFLFSLVYYFCHKILKRTSASAKEPEN